MSSESPHFGEHASDVSQEQERLKIESQKQLKEYEIRLEELKLEQKRVEERIRIMEEETKQLQYRAQYEDQLARKRYEDQQAQQARMYDMIRIEEKEGKAAEESITHVFGRAMGTAAYSVIVLTLCAGGVSVLVSSYNKGKRNYILLFRFLEKRFMKPSLVLETSRFTIDSFVQHPIKTISTFYKSPEDPMKGIILKSSQTGCIELHALFGKPHFHFTFNFGVIHEMSPVKPTLEQRLRDFAKAAREARDTGGYFRNMLLHGPPGTGKSMFAKSLAKQSGLDFALMLGSDVAPLGKKALAEVHKVFNWAHTSRKGMVLFVDYADDFLVKRSTDVISQETRAALNAFLYITGKRSNKLMLVLASNQPEQFDWAFNDLLYEKVEFEIPSYEERERLMRYYFQQFFLEPVVSESGLFYVEELDYDKKFAEIADQTEGFTGRDIFRLCLALQANAYAADGVITDQMINKVVKAAIEHKQKIATWEAMSSREMPAITAPGTETSK